MSGYPFRATRQRLGLDRGVLADGKWQGCPFWIADARATTRPLIPAAVRKAVEAGKVSRANRTPRKISLLAAHYRKQLEAGYRVAVTFAAPILQSDRRWTCPVRSSGAVFSGRHPLSVNADFVEHIERCFSDGEQWWIVFEPANSPTGSAAAVLAFTRHSKLLAVVAPIRGEVA